MNGTLVDNLKSAGGLADWDESREALTKTFDFDSFEQCQAFVQSVGKFAESKDHHPEWETANGGQSITVRLTSHFAGNQVTLSDYQLASHMNSMYTDTKSTFNPYPRMSESQLISMCVASGSLVVGFTLFKYFTAPYGIETDVHRGAPLARSGTIELESDVRLALTNKLRIR